MKRAAMISAALLGLALGAVALAAPPAWYPEPVVHNSWQVMGFSTTYLTGWEGIAAMVQACHADYPATRVCTEADINNTTALYPIDAVDDAWLMSPGACGGWRLGGFMPWARLVTPQLQIDTNTGQTNNCDSARPVSCCALIQVPEPTSSLGIGAGAATLAALGASRGKL